MDGTAKHKRALNPGKNAMLISKITFFFVFPIFRRTVKKEFKDDDVYEGISDFNSKALGDKLETTWIEEKQKGNPSYFKCVCKVFGIEYIYWGLLTTVVDISMVIVKPLLIGKIVAYFIPNQTKITMQLVTIYAVLLIGTIMGTIIFSHTYNFIMKQLCLKIQIATSTLIYRKILKLNTCVAAKAFGGQAITLITKDVAAFEQAMLKFHQLIAGVLQMIVMTYLLYVQIEVSAFVGLGVLLIFIAIQAFCGSRVMSYRLTTSRKTDERIQLNTEILSAIRVIKMYAWELFFYNSIDKLRRKEIRSLQIMTYIKLFSLALGLLSTKLALYGCIVTFIALGHHITAEKAFVVTACFTTLRTVLNVHIPLSFVKVSECKAAVSRINNYLIEEEIVEKRVVKQAAHNNAQILLKNVTVNYGNHIVLKLATITLKPGITLVTGAIGSGKSTLLRTILGDITASGTIEVTGKISYASQDPWLFPGTIRQNIIFNDAFNKGRYENVIKICALQRDFELLHSKDETLLTDKGLNLSKGQKVRINLARAIYKDADIYLLDDCLSALDLKVSRQIFTECILGFLKSKLCVLVSHTHSFLDEVDVVLQVSEGKIKSFDGFREVKQIEHELDTVNHKEGLENCTQTSKNVYEENKEVGSVKKEVYYSYFLAGGIKMFIAAVILSVLRQAAETWSDYFVRFWVESEQNLDVVENQYFTNSSEYAKAQEEHNSITKSYSLVLFAAIVLVLLNSLVFFMFVATASINLHRKLMDRILKATMNFFDRNRAGNIINRFSRDFSVIDEHLPYPILECIRVTLTMTAIIVVVSSVNPWFLIPSLCFMFILYMGRRLYVPSGRNIRRIEGSTRSPVVGHMQATFDGLTTIRASEAQKVVSMEFENYQDIYNSTQYMHLATMEAFGFYMDIFTGFYIGAIIFTLPFIANSLGPGQAGLAITQSFALTGLLHWCVIQWSELEIQMTSAERVLEYLKVESEDQTGSLITDWPKNGNIAYKDVSLRYSKDFSLILKNITFSVDAGEKIGIVGRTGAGKSSIITALFYLYPFEGTITIDGIDIKTVNVELLRSKISIMPQDPTLFSGSIRSNLDPNLQYTDKQLWTALEEVDMKNAIDSLDLVIKDNCNQFSLGQKQLICLARIILQNNSIFVLDEATANVDAKTDTLIQRTIRTAFANKTIIIIAHRLDNVIDCDKILVMDEGVVLELGNPRKLLESREGFFYKSVIESGVQI